MPGSKFWALSYIVLFSGKKIWLHTDYYELKHIIESAVDNQTIEIEKSGFITNDAIRVKKSQIEYYGKA